MDSSKALKTTKDSSIVEATSRRDFFKKTAIYSAGALSAASVLSPVSLKADDKAIINDAPWGQKLGDVVNKNPYGMPSVYEHNNIRRTHDLLSSGDAYASISMCPIHESEGIITPNGLFFTRNHGGTAQIDPNEYRLMIHGKVKREVVLTLEDIKRYPSETRTYFIECPANGSPEWRAPQFNSLQFMKGMMSSAQWTGVMLKTILEDIGLEKDAVWMLAVGSDNASNPRTIPVEKALDDVMVVWGQNGEALRPEQGYPIRLVVPGWEGNLNTKWLNRLEFSDKPWHAKEETSKYTMLQKSGKAIRFFWVNEVNSVITKPCPEKPWTHLKKGDMVEIEGIAWSGHGTIKGVDISFDGGDNWVEAKLKGLVLPKSWTRFSYIYKWDGKPLLLSSRAYDDFGNIQPTIDEETAAVGVESVYHRNAIVTWEITAKGECNNVHIRKHKKA
ncbi:sulfite dehydrogenase [Aliarcobacter cibarius]|uniref:Sulfur oxidation protein SoxCD, sulfur dehydrogenase subunit n=1 Tax=Aliarcobacter cibarius TaxID=255507 RepID=A0A5J6RJ86_9BACT|nr:sulfite dehydrogenase [Aliarcobacter cibarius]QEZ88818.1 sulfur oxidation protein SoxCD, sulfur dehydrogenase subunit [Aliarcobacter cibarius]QKJ26852.1 sulfur oxidation protein SoxCD, sulfur dehydrogenase subunit [Aliarcobacter cibarius]TLT03472.1 sulfite dehydrogenase [Aliarcobacter cibarius]